MEIKDQHIELFKEVLEKYPKPRVSKIYRMDSIAKAYLGLPSWFPLAYLVLLEHGIALQNDILRGKLADSKNEIILVDTKLRQELLYSNGKEGYVLGPLFVHARRMRGIKAKPDARGTLVFPVHASYSNTIHFDWERYVQSLLDLPEEYHPFTACIYWLDVIKGRHKIFEKYGIKVVTNGHIHDPEFAFNCVQYISEHKYCTGNELVSSMFYAVEMGIPFFLFGNDQGLVSEKSDYRKKIDKHPNVKRLKDSFTKTRAELNQAIKISKAEKDLVDFYIDEKAWMAPEKIRSKILARMPSIILAKALSVFKPK